ncbi:MAG TPA: hypothetical protein VGP06_09990 [Janthinobacterium sp.]|nr:hypothetical protein [Janthinobacterium sp.]
MPAGANSKREREYRELENRFKKEGRYAGREEQVAARIVNKQRAENGETKGAKAQAKQGKAPQRDLPIKDYQELSVEQIRARLADLSGAEVRKIRSFESAHKNRKGVIAALESRAS